MLKMVSNTVAKIQQIFGFGKKKEIFIKNLNPQGFYHLSIIASIPVIKHGIRKNTRADSMAIKSVNQTMLKV